MNPQRGFTLVELMVVIAVMGILAAVSIPASLYWTQNAKITNVKGDFSEAVGRAKNAALRNQRVASAREPVAAICISETHVLSVLEGSSTQVPACADGIGTELWTTTLDAKVSISANSVAVSCICFDNLGLLTDTLCAGCLTQPNITLAINNLDETVYTY